MKDAATPPVQRQDVQQRIKLLRRMERLGLRRNDMLQDLVDTAKARLLDLGLPDVAADLVAHDIVDQVADVWGGQSMSFPRDYQWFLAQRELEFYDRWARGEPLADLTRDSGMTERGMRKMLERIQRKLRRQAHKEQTDLFN
jgi:Mor family transcriptional regulator